MKIAMPKFLILGKCPPKLRRGVFIYNLTVFFFYLSLMILLGFLFTRGL